MHFGEYVRKMRKRQKLLQRQVAASLEIDTPMFSKIERGERKAKKEQVEQLATIFEVDKKSLLTLWLAEHIFELIKTDEFGLDAVRLVEKHLTQQNRK